MEKIVTILLLCMIFSLVIYSIYVQLSWFNENKYETKHNEYIQDLFEDKGLTIQTIINPSKRQIKNNSFSSGIHISLGGSGLGALEKVYYKIIIYTENNIKKEVWVKIIESVYTKTRYKFSDTF